MRDKQILKPLLDHLLLGLDASRGQAGLLLSGAGKKFENINLFFYIHFMGDEDCRIMHRAYQVNR